MSRLHVLSVYQAAPKTVLPSLMIFNLIYISNATCSLQEFSVTGLLMAQEQQLIKHISWSYANGYLFVVFVTAQ